MTTREVSPDGMGPRTTLELGGRERHLRGLCPTKDEYLLIRERWAQLTNEALRDAGLAARVDHRSLARQGIDREPTPAIPEKVFYAERNSRGTQRRGAMPSAPVIANGSRRAGRAGARASARAAAAEARAQAASGCRISSGDRHSRKRIRWGALTRAQRNDLRREQLSSPP